jgi:hypothetical protein
MLAVLAFQHRHPHTTGRSLACRQVSAGMPIAKNLRRISTSARSTAPVDLAGLSTASSAFPVSRPHVTLCFETPSTTAMMAASVACSCPACRMSLRSCPCHGPDEHALLIWLKTPCGSGEGLCEPPFPCGRSFVLLFSGVPPPPNHPERGIHYPEC